MNLPSSAVTAGVTALRSGTTSSPAAAEVIEIGLLLPAQQAQALMELSRRRKQSVGQVLRGLIDAALHNE